MTRTIVRSRLSCLWHRKTDARITDEASVCRYANADGLIYMLIASASESMNHGAR